MYYVVPNNTIFKNCYVAVIAAAADVVVVMIRVKEFMYTVSPKKRH